MCASAPTTVNTAHHEIPLTYSKIKSDFIDGQRKILRSIHDPLHKCNLIDFQIIYFNLYSFHPKPNWCMTPHHTVTSTSFHVVLCFLFIEKIY